MSRRSSRRATKKELILPESARRGLTSLVEGNETMIAKMLSVDDSSDADALVRSLTDCMRINDLSAEALLARFFDASVLSEYCTTRLGKSGKGNEATLAARIGRAWADPKFEAKDVKDGGDVKADSRPAKKPRREGSIEAIKPPKER